MNLLTPELIERCHAGSRAKGFWDETPPQGQQLMLVVSELAESLEAHRKNKQADWSRYEFLRDRHVNNPKSDKGFFVPADFADYIKDTVGDELADAYIRLCDFIGGFELDVNSVINSPLLGKSLPANYGAALLVVTGWVVAASENELAADYYLGDALSLIQSLCEREGIDLATHIDLKLRYNATRPAKHGKAY